MTPWISAASLSDCAELTAQWLEGSLADHPWYDGPPDSETVPLAPVLARLNRAGILTTCSQPGDGDVSSGSAQRAFLTAYTTEAIALRVATLALSTSLIVLAYPPAVEWGCHVPVTTEDFHPFTWCGRAVGVVELGSYEGSVSRRALEELRNAWELTTIDPEWGRRDYLWSVLEEWLDGRAIDAARYSPGPFPGHHLDTDFVY